jgi:hypothetical protein
LFFAHHAGIMTGQPTGAIFWQVFKFWKKDEKSEFIFEVG